MHVNYFSIKLEKYIFSSTQFPPLKTIRSMLRDEDKVVLVQTAPAVRVALGEEFGLEPGTIVTGKMAAALRRIGFDYVFDTDWSADLTIMEEGTELLHRVAKVLNGEKVAMPQFTSCCPAWIMFM